MALFFVFSALFAAMAGRFVVLQVVEADEYRALAADFRQREIVFPAHRGSILDRNGEALAQSVDLQTVYAEPTEVEDPAGTAAELAPLLDVPPKELARRLRGGFPGDRFEYLARQVDPKTARRVAELGLAGVHLMKEPKRIYPNARLASHLLGFVNVDGDALGGIELQYDDILKGSPGRMILEQDPSGRHSLPQADFEYRRALPGRSLYLTIDKDLQYFTEHALRDAVARYSAEAGSAIVLDPSTGEILAMANLPDFDPNTFNRFEDAERRNRAVTDLYEPGSAFKIVTAAAVLEEGVATPRRTLTVPDALQVADRVIHDSHAHPVEEMSVARVIAESSNVGTVKLGIELGAERIDSWVRRFGFGRKSGLDFPGEAAGIVLDLENWSGSTIGTVPLGQGIAVTPLQMAAAYAAIANGGSWVEPKILYSSVTAQGEVTPASPAGRRRVVSPRTARRVRKMLVGVVEEGTGVEARIPGYVVAGKTGTAQKPLPTGGYGDSHIASFAGMVPAHDPQLVVLVVLDEPTPIWGGSTAAPTFRTIAEFALRHLGVPPSGNAQKAARELEEAQAQDPVVHD
ncbi:MAG TPA: penicillin-binding protein 2 [Actinomycetota bacterium]|nr:penicillin-binding protein 2 [Actinomycetota bacterium]